MPFSVSSLIPVFLTYFLFSYDTIAKLDNSDEIWMIPEMKYSFVNNESLMKISYKLN